MAPDGGQDSTAQALQSWHVNLHVEPMPRVDVYTAIQKCQDALEQCGVHTATLWSVGLYPHDCQHALPDALQLALGRAVRWRLCTVRHGYHISTRERQICRI